MHHQKLSPAGCGLADLSTHKWSRVHAYLVAPLIKSLYLPVDKSPVVGAAPNGDNPAGCRPNGLHLLPTTGFKRQRNGKPKMPWNVNKKTGLTGFVLSLVLASSAHAAVTMIGIYDCGEWFNPQKRSFAKTWLNGYLSGLSSAQPLGQDVLKKSTSTDQIYLYIDNYCKANPLKNLAHAGNELFLEMKP